jgi:NTP pyrophosphatase (non-canonical NTP hydrolase)
VALSLRDLQVEHSRWAAYNFPEAPGEQFLMGMMEEMGELAHCHLKASQAIRGFTDGFGGDAYLTAATDAIADFIIFAAGYCNRMGIDLEMAVQETWEKVRERDWIKYPDTGIPA